MAALHALRRFAKPMINPLLLNNVMLKGSAKSTNQTLLMSLIQMENLLLAVTPLILIWKRALTR